LLRSRLRFADWLRNDAADHTLDGDDFKEAAVLRELQATSVSKSMLSHFQALRVMQRYLAGEYQEAWTISRQSDELLPYSVGMMTIVEHAFFQCLAVTALWPQASGDERAALTARLEAQSRALETWAASCPQNFAPLQLTVAAESARVRGEADAAGELFERALVAARDNRFLQVEAIACELAMRHWLGRDAARAESLRARAIAAYLAWGATRKANALRVSSAHGS